MEAIFMDTENGKTNESNRFLYGLTDNLNLRYPNKNIALSNSSIYYTWRNIKSAYNNNKFKISAATWSYEVDLPDGSNSILDIPDYFEYIIKKHETVSYNSSVQIYVIKIKNRIVFRKKGSL